MARMDHVTQIGNPGEEKGIYLEDYAYTYLKKQQDTERKKYYLYGKKEVAEDREKLYIYGISDSPREENRYFKNWYPLGMLKIKNGEKFLVGRRGEEIHLTGFYVFYAPNQGMQEYLIDHSKGSGEEEKISARAERQKREGRAPVLKKMNIAGGYFNEGKKKQDVGNLVFFAGCFLALVLFAVAITSGNGYEKLSNLKQMVLATISGSMPETEEFVVEEQIATGDFVSSQLLSENEQASEESLRTEGEEGNGDTDRAMETEENASAENMTDEPASAAETEEYERKDTQQEGEQQENIQEVTLQAASTTVAEEYESYIVQEGDTLAAICQLRYGGTAKIKEICEYNGIKNEDHIAPGQKLYLPK